MAQKDILKLLDTLKRDYDFMDFTKVKKEVVAPKNAKKIKKTDKKGETKLKIECDKNTHFSDWYTEVITKGDLINYYNVSGCYILKPDSYFIWE